MSAQPSFNREFWRAHALWPGALFAAAFYALAIGGLDTVVASDFFFDASTQHWLGSGAGDWWAHRILHDDGRWVVRGIAAAAIAVWLLSFVVARLRPWGRMAGFVALSMVLSIGIVGVLKLVTNVDCPWDLAGYGGTRPRITLFGERPESLPHAACFPGAHASSGFALLCFYFASRDRAPRFARWALLGAILVGVTFSVAQEARGAHFLSHDLASAAIVWFVQLGLYAWLLYPAAHAVPSCETSTARDSQVLDGA